MNLDQTQKLRNTRVRLYVVNIHFVRWNINVKSTDVKCKDKLIEKI